MHATQYSSKHQPPRRVVLTSCRAEAADSGCQLTITLHTEAVADAAAAQLFPANALRNAALLNAYTQLVLVVDGDMQVAPALSAQLATPAGCAAAFLQCSSLSRVPSSFHLPCNRLGDRTWTNCVARHVFR